MTLPPQPPLPKDADDIPVLGLYVPGQGVVAAQGVFSSTDAYNVPTASLIVFQSSSTSATLTSVAAATSSTQLLAANTSRKGMVLENDSAAILYLAYAASASTTAYTVQIPANTFFEMPTNPVYTGTIFGIWSAASGNARITELT